MGNALKILNGYKTYLGTIAIGVIGILWKAELIDTETAGLLGTLAASLTGAAMRSAIAGLASKKT